MAEYHQLFLPDVDEDIDPEEIMSINVARLLPNNKKIPDTQSYRPDELPNLHMAGELFGSGEYWFAARRLNTGPDGQKAGTVAFNKTHLIGTEYGPPKRMIPAAAPNSFGQPAPQQNGTQATAAAVQIPGIPPIDALNNPLVMMMWMMNETRQAEERARRDAREQAERSEQRQQQFFQLIMNSRQPQESTAQAVASTVSAVADTFKAIHAPPPPPAPAPQPQPTVSQQLADLKNIADLAKSLKGNEDVELVKAVGQGLAGLAGLGGITGAPGT